MPTPRPSCTLPGSAGIVEDCLSAFFSSLMVDLQGAQMSFMSLAILPGMG